MAEGHPKANVIIRENFTNYPSELDAHTLRSQEGL